MSTRTQCSHCRTEFSVPETAIGQQATCPKCQQRFTLQAIENSGEPVVQVREAQETTPHVAVDVQSASVPIETTDVGSNEAIPIRTDATVPVGPIVSTANAGAPSQSAIGRRRPAPSKGSMTPWIIAGVASVLAVVAVVAVLLNQGGSNPSLNDPANNQVANGGTGSGGQLVLHVGEAAQETLSLLIDGAKQSLSTESTQQIALTAGAHKLLLRRRGYEPIDHDVTITNNATYDYTPAWKKIDATAISSQNSSSALGSWGQNVEVAQRAAKQNATDVLVLFIGSDWSAESQRIISEGLASAPVQQAIAGKLELVVLDYPMTRAMGTQVEDPVHNQWMMELYNVNPDELPVMLGLDAEGKPFGVLTEISGRGADLAQQIATVRSWRSQRDTVIRNSTSLRGAQDAVDWLDEHQVLQFHRDVVLRCYQMAQAEDGQNRAGKLGPFFEAMWKTEMHRAMQDGSDKIPLPLDTVLTQWHEGKRFESPERGGRMHLTAAIVALRLDDMDSAKKYAGRAREYTMADQNLTAAVQQLNQLLEHSGELGSGTGFVVADGYILTNYHVVKGPGQVRIGYSDNKANIEGRVVATDAERDLALVLVRDVTGTPLPVSVDAPGRGAQVAAFGYPLGDAIGGGLKLTTGVISGLPDTSTDDMFLLDIRVNPGNSGGPLCGPSGAVVGMVTARTLSGAEVDSYGMAIPARTITTFLRRYIPKYEPPPALDVAGGWDRVDAAVNRSVLRVVKTR